MSTPRILFLSPGLEEYLSDGLFHGLRSLLGDRAVDYPKHEILYDTCPPEVVRSIRGGGMTLYGLLEDIPVSRARVWEELRWGEFDLAVFADVTNRFGAYVELLPYLGGTTVALLDGSDAESIYPYAGRWWRRRAWWGLPRAHRRHAYFKRELTPLTLSYRRYRLLPPRLAAAVTPLGNLRPISYSIPAEKIVSGPPEKDRIFATQVVDPEVAARLDQPTGYAFADEEEYYDDLRRSSYGITTRRGGWDCLRHYELAANGCVPCFRDLDRKPATCAPHGLDETNCVVYRDADDLFRKLDRIGPDEYASLRDGSLAWAHASSTVERARGFLSSLGFELPASARLSDQQTVEVDHVA